MFKIDRRAGMKWEYLENVQTPFVTSRMTVGVSAMLNCYVEEEVVLGARPSAISALSMMSRERRW